jgi:two-component SAPR family response regulator
VATFGALRVYRNGSEIAHGAWGRKRARDLFKLLLLRHQSWVTLDEIHEKLWGGDPRRRVETLVMNSASHIRNAIEPRRGRKGVPTMLRCSGGAYMLDLGSDASIDFVQFKELIVSARRAVAADARLAGYASAIALYHGDFLQEDIYHDWTSFERDMLRDAYLEALDFIARERLRAGRYDEAIEYSRRILEHDRTCERAYQMLLAALADRGRVLEAQRVLSECERAFREELGAPVPERLRILGLDARRLAEHTIVDLREGW